LVKIDNNPQTCQQSKKMAQELVNSYPTYSNTMLLVVNLLKAGNVPST